MAEKLEGNARIAPTAHYTAQAWVRAGFPNAGIFDTRTGRTMFNGAEQLRRVGARFLPPLVRHAQDHLYVRHFVHEERIRQLAPEFILEVGAGLSPRGLSFALNDPNLTYVEADLPGMVAAKRAQLSRAGVTPPGNYFLGTSDLLSDNFLAALPARPKKGQRVVIVTEGVTDYLSMDEKRIAFANLASVLRAAGGGTYQTELYTRERFSGYGSIARASTAALGLLVGRRFDDRLFSSAQQGADFLVSCGFDSAQVLDAESLNPGPYRPPMDICPWQLVEARVNPAKPRAKKSPKKTTKSGAKK